MYKIIEIKDLQGNPKLNVDHRKNRIISNIDDIIVGCRFLALDEDGRMFMLTSKVEAISKSYDPMTMKLLYKVLTENSMYIMEEIV